ncbi:hypothetical protein BN1723_005556 [Verticillium longisporum]|uniref:Indole-diterpene biosynthesis protein PaxU n=2 Tax=Verticillium longisporum TaxID=100787 RepID=A0A0G4NA61_VERLO|nr:hypothetical protein BN1723_005556 [Verticillium longisporum]
MARRSEALPDNSAHNATTPFNSDPFLRMRTLTPSTLLYDPPSPSQDLTILFAWYAASDAHIAKYLSHHLILFPHTRLLLIKHPATHVLSRSRFQAALAPALSLIAGLSPPASDKDHRLRLHVFSNGGAASLHRLLALLGPAALPPHVAVFDSCPAPFRFRRTYGALATGVPWPLAPLLCLLLAIYWLLHVPLRRSSSLDRAAAALNAERATVTELRRTYVYSAHDKMVGWKDVEAHADEAAARGLEVRRERFVGSGHVAHARIDSARYWKVITETFKKVDEADGAEARIGGSLKSSTVAD